jgi:hypothetical protein
MGLDREPPDLVPELEYQDQILSGGLSVSAEFDDVSVWFLLEYVLGVIDGIRKKARRIIHTGRRDKIRLSHGSDN